MIISVINHTSGKIKDEEVLRAIRAINRQIRDDFEPYWSMGARLRLEGHTGPKPEKEQLGDMRGDAVLYLWDQTDVDDALGYHDKNHGGIPYGFVFTDLVKKLGESWTVTLSHEALEAIADPDANLLVVGPHPEHPDREVFHWYEMCDAVQDEHYEVDGMEVSNFVLPLYFTSGDEASGRNDFLGRLAGKNALRSFGVNPGGYIGFFDPTVNDHVTWSLPKDKRAQQRIAIKGAGAAARRASRRAEAHLLGREPRRK